jgi:hypothetical protein
MHFIIKKLHYTSKEALHAEYYSTRILGDNAYYKNRCQSLLSTSSYRRKFHLKFTPKYTEIYRPLPFFDIFIGAYIDYHYTYAWINFLFRFLLIGVTYQWLPRYNIIMISIRTQAKIPNTYHVAYHALNDTSPVPLRTDVRLSLAHMMHLLRTD